MRVLINGYANVVATCAKRRGLNNQEVRYVCKVPDGFRLARDYPYHWTWPVRPTLEGALKDDQ